MHIDYPSALNEKVYLEIESLLLFTCSVNAKTFEFLNINIFKTFNEFLTSTWVCFVKIKKEKSTALTKLFPTITIWKLQYKNCIPENRKDPSKWRKTLKIIQIMRTQILKKIALNLQNKKRTKFNDDIWIWECQDVIRVQ